MLSPGVFSVFLFFCSVLLSLGVIHQILLLH